MMTPKDAVVVLTKLSEMEKKRGRVLHYMATPGWAFCPVCGTSQMKDFSFEFVAVDGRDEVSGNDGLMMIFYINHPGIFRRCLFGLAGAPAHGDLAKQLLLHGEALQVIQLEHLMRGVVQ